MPKNPTDVYELIASQHLHPKVIDKVRQSPAQRRPTFGSIVLPAAMWLGLAYYVFVLGCLVFVFYIWPGLGGISLWQLIIGAGPAWAFGFFVGYAMTISTFKEAQVIIEEDNTEFFEDRHVPKDRYIVTEQTVAGTRKLVTPAEPKPGAYREFVNDVLEGKESFSLAAARKNGYTRNSYEELRDWALQQGFLKWNNPDHPTRGLALTRHGREAFTNSIQEQSRLPLRVPPPRINYRTKP